MSKPKLHIAKKSCAMFGTQSTGSIFYRFEKVAAELKRRGWEVYKPLFEGKGHPPYLGTKDGQLQYQWQKETTNLVVSYRMEQMVRHSYFTVYQFAQSRMAVQWMLAMREKTHIPIFTDIDDDIFNVDAWNPGVAGVTLGQTYQFCAKEQMDGSDGVLVSTRPLADAIAKQTTNQNIIVCPNGLEPEWKGFKNTPTFKSSKGKTIRIGWQGANAHNENLRVAKEAIFAILHQYPHVEFFFFGPTLPDWIEKSEHPRIKFLKAFLNVDEYQAKLASLGFDIGIAPLQDTFFNRGKSNLRWMEYSALKIPTVVSRVAAYECVRHDVDGLVVNGEDEWVTALSSLIQSETKRKAIGEQAYERVWRDFHIGKAADVYEHIYRKYLAHNKKLIEETKKRFKEAKGARL